MNFALRNGPYITDQSVSNIKVRPGTVNDVRDDNARKEAHFLHSDGPPSNFLMSDPSSLPAPRAGGSISLALLATGSHRAELTHWWAWWHDISSVAYSVSDPGVAERKLAWWAQAVSQGFREPPQHPLLTPLLGTVQARASAPPLKYWLNQLEGQQQLTQQTRWLDDATLMRHIQKTTASACEGAAWLMGVRDPASLAVAADFGMGLRRAHILFRLGQDARQGWLHIPIDVLQAHEVRAHQLLKSAPGEPSSAIIALLDTWQALASGALRDALQRMQGLPAAERRLFRGLMVLAKLNLALLDDLHQARYPVFGQRMILGPWRKRWIAQLARIGS